MHLNLLKAFSSNNPWIILMPEILLILISIIPLLGSFVPSNKRKYVLVSFIFAQILLIFWMCKIWGGHTYRFIYFNGMLEASKSINLMRMFFVLFNVFLSHLFIIRSKINNIPFATYTFLTLCAASLMIFVQSCNVVLFVITIEFSTILVLFIINLTHRNVKLVWRLFTISAIGTLTFLLGLSLLCITIYYNDIPVTSKSLFSFYSLQLLFAEAGHVFCLAKIGSVLLICGLCMKFGIAPFHIWITEACKRTDSTVIVLLCSICNGAGIFALMRLKNTIFVPIEHVTTPIILCLAVVAILIGSLMSVNQEYIKSLIAAYSISWSGYMLAGVMTIGSTINYGQNIIVLSMFAFLISIIPIVLTSIMIQKADESMPDVWILRGLSRKNKLLSFAFIVGLGSVTGMLPFVGFFSKFLILAIVFKTNHVFLLGIGLLGIIISLYSSLYWIDVLLEKEGFKSLSNSYKATQTPFSLQCDKIIIYFYGTIPLWFLFFTSIFIN